jgi:hypothetical protein
MLAGNTYSSSRCERACLFFDTIDFMVAKLPGGLSSVRTWNRRSTVLARTSRGDDEGEAKYAADALAE